MKQNFSSFQMWWENTKIEIGDFTRKFCSNKAKKRKNKINSLKKNINSEYEKPNPDKNILTVLLDELNILNQIQHAGTMIRSREKLITNEEKPTKYFYVKEQVNQKRKIINSLKVNDENDQIIITDPKLIQKHLKEYYTKLFQEQPVDVTAQNEILQHTKVKLSNEQREYLEAPLTEEEIFNAIRDTETNKSPGIDGIPIEFYSKFWNVLKDDFVEMANMIYIDQQTLTITQKTGIIVLIFKRDDEELLGNWRPITLLCIDYKIISKTLATRLRHVLPHLIHEDQTCSVPNRYIFSNHYTIRDAITYSQSKNQNLFIVSYDFEKAFDSVHHKYFYNTLEHMKFGPTFINFFKNTYKGRTSMVMNNGRMTGRIILKGIPARGFALTSSFCACSRNTIQSYKS